MESSTSSKPHSLRRSLLRASSSEGSPAGSPLRKSIGIAISPNLSFMEEMNDEEERSRRRGHVEMQNRLSNLSSGRSNLSESYVKEQFVICTNLYTENKITAKNAWKLQIIDMLKPLCQKSDKDKLQVASTSIDISAKVYGLRVDDLHSDGLKLAGSMARVVEKEAPDQDGDGNCNSDDDDDNAVQSTKRTRKIKKKRPNFGGDKNTVNVNVKAFTGNLQKLEPVEFTTRISADGSPIENLLTNVIKEDDSGYTFALLDKTTALFPDTDLLIQTPDENQNYLLGDLPRLESVPLTLNAPFKDFAIGDWDPNENDWSAKEKPSMSQTVVVFDDQGIPVQELDGSIHDIFENADGVDNDLGDEDDVQSIHEECVPQLRGEVAHIDDFRAAASNATMQISEYSFNSVVSTHSGKYIDRIWAGPSHWKLKFIRKSAAKFSGQQTVIKEKQARRRAKPEMIDFDRMVEIDLSQKVVMRKRRPVASDKITLPIKDQSCIKLLNTIKELMLKPGVCPVEKKVTDAQLDCEVVPYKYENPNDSLYCSQHVDDDDDPVEDDGVFDSEERVAFEQQRNFAGENLVDVPQMVPKSYVPYALKAKQMDMRKLKAAIWQCLTNTEGTSETETKDNTVAVVPKRFSDIYSDLPNRLGDREKAELSSALAFAALLHLCNEKNLQLIQLPGYKDFEVKGPSEESWN